MESSYVHEFRPHNDHEWPYVHEFRHILLWSDVTVGAGVEARVPPPGRPRVTVSRPWRRVPDRAEVGPRLSADLPALASSGGGPAGARPAPSNAGRASLLGEAHLSL